MEKIKKILITGNLGYVGSVVEIISGELQKKITKLLE